MRAAHEVKANEVKELASKIDASEATIIVQYRGLTVTEITELRSQLREVGGELKVIKNNITKRAVTEQGFETLTSELEGPNAIAFASEESLPVVKVLAKFAKTHEALVLKSGIVDGEVADNAVINELATMPSKDELLAMFASMLQSPLRNFAYGVSQIAENAPQDEAAATEVEVKEETTSEEAVEVSTEEVKTEETVETTEESAPEAEEITE